MKKLLARGLLFELMFLTACGAAEIVVPEPLRVLDTSPSNGAVVPTEDGSIVIAFSEDMDITSLGRGILVEEIDEAFRPVSKLAPQLGAYSTETFVATYGLGDLDSATRFRFTLLAEELRGASGARLQADLVRMFRTD